MKKTAAKIKRPTRTAAVTHAGVCESVVIVYSSFIAIGGYGGLNPTLTLLDASFVA
jgi:hypothetical protein